MAGDLEIFARAERGFLQEEMKWLRGGAKHLSPSGDDITASKLAELERRLEHANGALGEAKT